MKLENKANITDFYMVYCFLKIQIIIINNENIILNIIDNNNNNNIGKYLFFDKKR